ncbi:hypothetical protein [Streptomyces griseus]|uniref:hypothetical protein n=1 Tax=Streptomyces griseus TaxID=1911 RepID=UPI0037AD05BF
MTMPEATAYVVLIGDHPTAVATDLATAQAAALADETRYSAADQYETKWDSYSPTEWRLMSRRKDRGGRYAWTRRSIRTAPLATPAT